MSKLNAYSIYLILRGADSFIRSMIYIGIAVYYIQTVGMNPLELVLIGTTIEITIFLFEIPTGVVADTFSRKYSVILGLFLCGVCFVLESLLPFFLAIVLAEVIRGVGETFISGALDAWIADEIGPERVGRAFLRASQIGQVSGVLGTFVAAGLSLFALNIPVLLGGIALIGLSIFLLFSMPENGFKPVPRGERNSWQAMGHTFGSGLKVVRSSRWVLTILLIGAVFGAFSEGYDRLWEARFLKGFTFPELWGLNPVGWFALFGLVGMFLSMIVTEVFRRSLDTNNHTAVARALLIINTLLIGSIAAFALAGNLWIAVGAFWILSLLRSINGPLYSAWLNQNLDSASRATVLSMGSQFDALGQLVGGPIIGLVALNFSIPMGLLVSGLILSPVLLLYLRTLRRDDQTSSLGVETNQ